jgi:hypothetical protein
MATINGSIKHISTDDAIDVPVAFTALSTPLVSDPEIYTGGTELVRCDSNGDFEIDLAPGDYEVKINNRDIFRITVPAGAGTYDIIELVESGAYFDPEAPALLVAAADITDATATGIALMTAANAAAARTALSLGTIATQAASAVAITGGTIAGLTSLSVTQGTITDPNTAITVTSTWNNGGTTFTGLKVDITNTVSAAGSAIADFLSGSYSVLKILPFGGLVIGNANDIAVGTTTGTKIGTSTSQKLGFWNVTPVVQQVLATGAGATVDNVISLLQTLGLCKQS